MMDRTEFYVFVAINCPHLVAQGLKHLAVKLLRITGINTGLENMAELI